MSEEQQDEPKMVETYLYFDSDEQFFVSVYTKDDNICPYYVLKDGVFKQAAAYISMKLDLMECIQAIQYLLLINKNQQIPKIVKSSLLFASIVKYAKCFTSGEGRGTSLNNKTIFKGERQEFNEFHDKTMDLRHKYLAHAGNSIHESRALIAILNPDVQFKSRVTIEYAGIRLMDDDFHLDLYLNLYNSILLYIEEKIEQLRLTVNSKADEISIDEMYETSKIPNPEKLIPFTIKRPE